MTNYQNHLYFEEIKDSKEFALDKCIKVLGLIARLKDRNQSISDMCVEAYGRSANGSILAPKYESDKYKRNLATIRRLKSYYNYCISKLEPFKLMSNNLK